MNIGNADIHKAADGIGGGGNAERHRWFIGCGTPAEVDDEPRVCDLDEPRRALVVAHGHNAAAEYLFVKSSRPFDVGNGNKARDGNPILGRHLVGFLSGLDLAQGRLQFDAVSLRSREYSTGWFDGRRRNTRPWASP